MDLIGDIGGTSARLALARSGRIIADSLWQDNSAGDDFRAVLRKFRAVRGTGPVRAVAIAGAGALRGARLPLTNRAMILDPDEIRAVLGDIPVLLFNDMVGQGHGLAQVPQNALRPLAGPVQADGTRLVVNIGTGLNACPVHQAGGAAFVPVAEAGNVTLPQTDASLRALASARGGEVVAEDVISGRGLPVLAARLAGREGCSAAEALDLGVVRETVFVALAAYLRDMVLTHMATGGVYLTGSVSAALSERFDWQELHRAMIGQRAYTDVLARVPIMLVQDPMVTLRGAAQLAARAA